MKKLLTSLLFLCFATTIQAKTHHTMVEIKPAFFYFQDKVARDIYGQAGFMPSIELDSIIYKNLHWFFELGFLNKDGHNTTTDADSDIYLLPISLGLKYIFSLPRNTKFYLKAAPNWLWAKEKQDYPAFKRSTTINTFGGTAGIGLLFYRGKHWIFDLFANYLYDRKTIRDRASDIKVRRYLGGVQAGIGIGCRW